MRSLIIVALCLTLSAFKIAYKNDTKDIVAWGEFTPESYAADPNIIVTDYSESDFFAYKKQNIKYLFFDSSIEKIGQKDSDTVAQIKKQEDRAVDDVKISQLARRVLEFRELIKDTTSQVLNTAYNTSTATLVAEIQQLQAKY